jgi:hypothetical protein
MAIRPEGGVHRIHLWGPLCFHARPSVDNVPHGPQTEEKGFNDHCRHRKTGCTKLFKSKKAEVSLCRRRPRQPPHQPPPVFSGRMRSSGRNSRWVSTLLLLCLALGSARSPADTSVDDLEPEALLGTLSDSSDDSEGEHGYFSDPNDLIDWSDSDAEEWDEEGFLRELEDLGIPLEVQDWEPEDFEEAEVGLDGTYSDV